jgi:heme/copper-type cytochrome/quinol oxidase subunit 1
MRVFPAGHRVLGVRDAIASLAFPLIGFLPTLILRRFPRVFLSMFGIEGLTGLPPGLAASGIRLKDTSRAPGHFHYLVLPGTLFAIFAGWCTAVSAACTSMGSLIGMNGILPMLLQGLNDREGTRA